MVNVENFEIECVCFLETLETGCVDQILYDVTLKQFGQLGRIFQNAIELSRGNQRESLVGWCEDSVRPACEKNKKFPSLVIQPFGLF